MTEWSNTSPQAAGVVTSRVKKSLGSVNWSAAQGASGDISRIVGLKLEDFNGNPLRISTSLLVVVSSSEQAPIPDGTATFDAGINPKKGSALSGLGSSTVLARTDASGELEIEVFKNGKNGRFYLHVGSAPGSGVFVRQKPGNGYVDFA